GWAAMDSPWTQLVDRQKFAQVLAGVRDLQPTRIFSSHLPAANGTSLDSFLKIIESVPDVDPGLPPSHEEFSQMLAMMMVTEEEPQMVAAT
ncbi:MAG: hypothetical protein KY395_07550, partial [Actinobacteria bacterium]|nr:hypothetical protein [Actinomycetota bacterium]